MAKGIKFNFSDLTDQLIVAWYKNTAPLAEVGRQVYNPGAGEKTLVPEGIGAGTYTFKFYSSSNGTTLDSLLTSWSIDGSFLSEGAEVEFYDYKVGRGQSGTGWADPVTGARVLNDTRLAGKTFRLFQPVTGMRPKGTYIELEAGGFQIPDDYPEFMAGEDWTAMVINVTAASSTPEPTATYQAVREVTASEAYSTAYHNQHNVSEYTGGILTTTFPAFNTLVDHEVTFSTIGAPAGLKYWVLQFASGNTINFFGARNRIILGREEKIVLQFKAAKGRVTHDGTNYHRIGQRIWLDDPNQVNTMIRDGRIVYEADDPRIYDWVAGLNSAWVVDFGTWETDKGLFAIDHVLKRIRIPDDRGAFIRGLTHWDGANHDGRLRSVPGGKQTASIDTANLDIQVREGQGGTATGPIEGTGFSGQDAAAGWISGTGGGLIQIAGSAAGTETRPANVGLIPGLVI